MSYFFALKNTSTLTSNREYISSSKTQLKNMYSKQDNMQLLMSNIQNKITLYVNFNKHKREYVVIPIIPIGGLLKTKQKPISI